MLGHQAIHDSTKTPTQELEASRRKQGVQGPSACNLRRPQSKRGKQAPRRIARNDDGGEGGRVRLHHDEGGRDQEGEGQEKQVKHPEEPDEAAGRETPRELSKEAALLKVAEDTEGGQGAMLFPEFVEAITRICLSRYGPWAAPRKQGSAAQGVANRGKGVANGGPGWRKTNAASGLKIDGKPFARGRKALVVSAMMLSHARTPKDRRSASVGLAIAHHRLRFAFEQHLLPEVVNARRTPTRRSNREIAAIMEVHTPRLTKMMEFFAVGGPSTAPPLAAVPKPTTSPLLKGQLSKTRDADVSGSLDMSTSRDGENSRSSINSGESHDDDDDGYDDDVGRPPSSAMQLPIGPDPSSVDAARERSPSCRALLRRRRPRPPAVKGKECRMSVREFIGMLRSLEVPREIMGWGYAWHGRNTLVLLAKTRDKQPSA